jgi:hypothetical protein
MDNVDTRLTKDEVNILYDISKQKAISVRNSSNDIYEAFVSNNPQEKAWLDNFDSFILYGRKMKFRGIEVKKGDAFSKELWNDGWKVRDPYWTWNFKAITPIIKRIFYDKQITTYMVKRLYDRRSMNDKFRELHGGLIGKFISIFNDEGEKYMMELNRIGILQKITKREIRYIQWHGIPNSVVSDLLGAMRTYSGK